MSEKWTARVYILDAPYHIDKPYDYSVGHDLRGILRAGAFVTLPFGSGGRQRKALVVSLGDDPGCPIEKLKSVTSAVDEDMWLSAEQLETCMFIKEHTFCTVGDAVQVKVMDVDLDRRRISLSMKAAAETLGVEIEVAELEKPEEEKAEEPAAEAAEEAPAEEAAEAVEAAEEATEE
jgi:primosomal protein N'